MRLHVRGMVARLQARLAGRAALYSWQAFGREVRPRTRPLLDRLSDFPGAVLVAGCQRSGTTVLTRLIGGAEGFERFSFTHDDELDAAQILAGLVEFRANRRLCFQTTYLNERFEEYWTATGDFRLIWVLRDPVATVYSMIYNWRRFALDELFLACGLALATPEEQERVQRFGVRGVRVLRRACLAYLGKTRQLTELVRRLPAAKLAVVDYKELIVKRDHVVPDLFRFIGEPYLRRYCYQLHDQSLIKAERMPHGERAAIAEACEVTYCAALEIARPLMLGNRFARTSAG